MSLVTNVCWRHVALIVLFASVARGGVLLFTHDQLSADPDAYRQIAECVKIHGTFGLQGPTATGDVIVAPTAYRPPLYPWLLSLIAYPNGNLSNFAIAIAHWILGTATTAGTYLLALQMLRSDVTSQSDKKPKVAAFLAAALVAIDPLLLQASSVVMTETLAASLVVLVLWLWNRWVDSIEIENRSKPNLSGYKTYSLLIGIAFGLAYLCRPTFILWPVLVAGYLLLLSVKRGCRRPLISGFIILAIVGAFVSAWTKRNVTQFGRQIWATTHGGYTLLLGNNDSYYDYVEQPNESTSFPFANAWDADFFIGRWGQRFGQDLREASFWDTSNILQRNDAKANSLGEIVDDKLAYEAAIATIQRRPTSFLMACVWRLRRLHSPFPLHSTARPPTAIWAVSAFYCVSLSLAAIGFWRLRHAVLAPRWVASVSLWVAIASVHTVYWTDMRMRAPAVPILSILAAAAVVPRSLGSVKT